MGHTKLALRAAVAATVAAAMLACGSSDGSGEEPYTCAIGELVGTWRWHYDETDGTCGQIPDETGIFDPNAEPAPGCTIASSSVSDDKCRSDTAFTCPTTDNLGDQSWVMVVHHSGAGLLTGTATVQINHSTLGTCRSTYDVTVTEL